MCRERDGAQERRQGGSYAEKKAEAARRPIRGEGGSRVLRRGRGSGGGGKEAGGSGGKAAPAARQNPEPRNDVGSVDQPIRLFFLIFTPTRET